MRIRKTLALLVATGALNTCALLQPEEEAFHSGERGLALAIRHYEDGEYSRSMRTLERSLDLGLSNRDQVTAHKYLAFLYCTSKQEAKCLAHFRMALSVDPSFDLQAAEAGHPMWGPAFRSVKSER